MITLTFPFAPVAWGRVKRGRYGQAYVPEKTLRFKKEIRLWASKYAPNTPLTGPIKVTARFFIQRPKKLKKGSRGFPITRPDLDNYLKGVFDALNDLIWEDDSQICHGDTAKVYDDLTGAGPRITLLVEEL